MKRIVILLGTLILQSSVIGQTDTVTLYDCYARAEKTYPLTRQAGMMDRSSDLKIKNLNKNYLPQLNLNGSASLQSDVTELGSNLPPQLSSLPIPKISKDWYRITFDVNQSIYDGSVTGYQKKLETVSLQADQKSLEVELYKIKDRINLAYFSIFMFQQNEAILNSTKDQLESKLKEIRSAVANGFSLASNADALEAETIKIDQQLIENRNDRSVAFQVLSELTSSTIPENSRLVIPVVQIASTAFEDKRPELQWYNIQQAKSGVLKDMVNTRWNPKLSAYGQAGYGRLGLNMLSNDFTPWWIVGAKLTWNIWNWNLSKNEKKIYEIQGDIIGAQKETFEKNLKIESDRGLAEIVKLKELQKKDEEIIELRKRISLASSSQLDNGVITSSDYISRLNEEKTAKLSFELHRIQLVKAKIAYLYILGKL
ncbi:MAG: TolC family protein [Bacteroidetes bacterium]|nr:TolC family protein [Bacteroidota bacterium]